VHVLVDQAVEDGFRRIRPVSGSIMAGGGASRLASHRVLMPDHQQLSIFGQVLAEHMDGEAEYRANML
jgi:hypothetical protein